MRTRAIGVAVGLALAAGTGRVAATVGDAGFAESVVWMSWELAVATGLEWAPDGSNRLFVIRQDGHVRIIKDGTLLPQPFAVMTPTYRLGECGLLGVAFDPDFLSTRHVYFFVTVGEHEQQIVRYTVHGDVGIDKTMVVAGLPTNGANHVGGAVGFGPVDGKLYWGIGDLGGDDVGT